MELVQPQPWDLHADDVTLVRLWPVAVPLVRPIRASHGTETVRRSTLVEVELRDGSVGWGECVALSEPTYTDEWAAGAFLLLATQLVPRFLARHRRFDGHPMAHFALRMALADARLRTDGENLAAALGGRPGVALPRTQVLGRPDTVEELVAAVDPTAAMVKIKIGGGWEAEPLAALRSAFPDMALAADANRSIAVGCDDLPWTDGLAYFEEPLLMRDWDENVVHCPVALDESLRHPDEWLRPDLPKRAIVNVKPARLDNPIWLPMAPPGSFVGGMYELGVGRAAALAFASGERFTTPTDLGPSSQYVAEDITDPIGSDASGRVVVPSGPGIGVEVHRDRVRAALVDQPVELRR